MKRDMELIRAILLKLEEDFEPGEGMKFGGISIEGYDSAIIGEHCELIYQAGLINDFKPQRGGHGNQLLFYSIGPLSKRGHEYLELIRNDEVWTQTKDVVSEKKIPKTIDNISRVAGTFVGAALAQILDK